MTAPQGAESSVLRAPRVLLALLTISAFGNATTNGFVWLDHWQVESGGLIARSWAELWSAVRQPLGAMAGWEGTAPYARPCVVLLLSLVHVVAGTAPAAYHLTLLLLHLANVLLVYGMLSTLGVDRSVAFITAALFGVHPLQTAAVSWVSGVADPLFGVFALLTLRLQRAASEGGRPTFAARSGAALSFVLALGAKEAAATLPLLMVAMDVWFPMAPANRRSRVILRAIAPFCIVLVAAALYRWQVLPGAAFGRSTSDVPLAVRLWTLPRLLLSYVTLPVRFSSLTVCDDYALSNGLDISTVSALAIDAVLVAGLMRLWRRSPVYTFGLLWMVIGLLPVLNIVPILHYRADRFFYFPMIGWSLACVSLLQSALTALQRATQIRSARLSRGAAVAAALGLLALVGLTIRRNAAYADDKTLFEATLQVSPFCREGHTTLGDAYLRAGRYAEAVVQYDQARSARPGHASYVVMPKVLINLGMAQLGRNEYAAAEEAFREAHRLQPQLLHPLFGLGIANLGLGRPAEAATWLEQAYAIAPDDPDVLLNLALSYDRSGRQTEAVVFYQRYLKGAPKGRARALAEGRIRALGAAHPY